MVHYSYLITALILVTISATIQAQEEGLDAPYVIDLPEGVLPPIIPDDNPTTKGKVMLGRKLYFDKRLSADNTVSCATCHDPGLGFADGEPVAVGIGEQTGSKNSPTTLNAAFYDFQFWDGRVETLEEQAKQPLTNPVEMGMPSHEAVVKKVIGIQEYSDLFQQVFGTTEITIDHIARAIAAFERSLISLNSPFDRFIAGDGNAISEAAKRGYPVFTNNKFHNIGVGVKIEGFDELARRAEQGEDVEKLKQEAGASELGRFLVTKKSQDIGAFKTPGLRNISLTAPYMHDGSEATLESVIEFYDRGGEPNPFLDGGMRPLDLTEEEENDLIEFLKTLTSDDITRLQDEFAGEME
jgi:cytochrome c peroxidase